MSTTIQFMIDGRRVEGRRGQSLLEAADEAGIYIPRLCWMKGLSPAGSCRVCTVKVNGRHQSACTQPVAPGAIVENDTSELRELRRNLIDMLFVEGNHFCMFCEKSGSCELQALAYRFGITAPKYPFMFPRRDLDATHPEIFIDRNRCILCARCIRASRELDGKNVFGFTARGNDKRIAVNSRDGLRDAGAGAADNAIAACPTGCLLVKRIGYDVPIGQRRYDHDPIGSEADRDWAEGARNGKA
jgi:[NiFe] hydrogenase diaphorase moiety small subunit